MKKFILIFTVLFLVSCAKTAREAYTSNMLSVKVDDIPIDNANIKADFSKRYIISFEELNTNEIDDNKQIIVSVSDGGLASSSSLTAQSGQVTLTVQAGKATCYYNPGRKAQDKAILSISVGGVTQFFNFKINPSEPTSLKLSANPTSPTITASVELTAYLLKDQKNIYASDNLYISFKIRPLTNTDSIRVIELKPDFSYSNYDSPTGFVIAKKTFSTNQKKGSLVAIATYTLNNTFLSDSVIIPFK